MPSNPNISVKITVNGSSPLPNGTAVTVSLNHPSSTKRAVNGRIVDYSADSAEYRVHIRDRDYGNGAWWYPAGQVAPTSVLVGAIRGAL